MTPPLIIGIDFGTSNCRVGAFVNGQVVFLRDENGEVLEIPNCVSFRTFGRVIGKEAAELMVTNAYQTIAGIRRLVGWGMPIGLSGIDVSYKGVKQKFTFTEIAAMVLGKIKQLTGKEFQHYNVTGAVISVPVSAGNYHRQAMIDAGFIAGFSSVRLVTDTTAIAIGHLQNAEGQLGPQNWLILDLGGGTFDSSVVTVDKSLNLVHVLSMAGDQNLGGFEFDVVLMGQAISKWKQQMNRPLILEEGTKQRLKKECEYAKKVLTCQDSYTMNFQFVKGEDFSVTLTRARFEVLTFQLRRRITAVIHKAFRASNIGRHQISKVVLSGLATQIPSFRSLIDNVVGNITVPSFHNDSLVLRGLAIQGGLLCRADHCPQICLLNLCPFAMGLCLPDGSKIEFFDGKTPIVIKKTNVIAAGSRTEMVCRVFEEEPGCMDSEKIIGSLHIKNIQSSDFINVAFETDINGIIKLPSTSLFSLTTNKLCNVNLKTLSRKELEYQEDDDIQNQTSDARNRLEMYVFQIQKQAETDLKVDTEKNEVIGRCKKILQWIEDNSDGATKKDYEKQYEKLIIEFRNPCSGSHLYSSPVL